MAIRLGQVDYTNVLPLFYPFTAGWVDCPAKLVPGTPAALNEALAAGDLDVSVVSSITYAKHQKSLVLLPDLSISSLGPVGSVMLFSKERFDELDGRQMALTSSSATSVALTRILCRWYFDIKVEYKIMDPDLDKMLAEASACLLIGDDALRARQNAGDLFVQDTGTAWFVLTGKPMVFAVWAARKDAVQRDPRGFAKLIKAIYEARRVGRENIASVIAAANKRVKMSDEDWALYYDQLKFGLGPEFQSGLLTFYDYCARMRLAPPVPGLEFVELG